MAATEISSESRQIRDYIEGLLKTLEASTDNTERLRIKDDIAKILSDNIHSMSAKDVQRFRDVVVVNKINIDLDELDMKISSSKSISKEILDQYRESPSLAAKMDLYRRYLKFIDGSFAVLILKSLLIDHSWDRTLDTNQVCVDFLINSITDLDSIRGNWELDTIKDELKKIILARESVAHSILKSALYEIADCDNVQDKIKVFNSRMNWDNRFSIEALNAIFKNCNRKDLSDPTVTEFFAKAAVSLMNVENFSEEDIAQRDFLVKRILKVESIVYYLKNNNLMLNTAN